MIKFQFRSESSLSVRNTALVIKSSQIFPRADTEGAKVATFRRPEGLSVAAKSLDTRLDRYVFPHINN